MRLPFGRLVALLAILSGCISPRTEPPTYASDDTRTRPWATCLAAGAADQDDGIADSWTIGQMVAEECAPRLLAAFPNGATEGERRKVYALTAQKAVAMVEANRRDAEASMRESAATAGGGEPAYLSAD